MAGSPLRNATMAVKTEVHGVLRDDGGLVKMTTSQAILARETVEASPR
jgi:hypothetical protein